MSRPMRILYLLNAAGGGATQGIVELLAGLDRGSFEAYVVVPETPDDRQRETFDRLAARTVVVPMTWWNRKVALPPLRRTLAWGASTLRSAAHARPTAALVKLIRDWDIDLVYTTTAVTLEGALAARLCGKPHLWHLKECVGSRGRMKFALPDPLLARTFTGLSRRVLVMSEFIGELFTRQELTRNLEIVNDGVDLNKFSVEGTGRGIRDALGVRDGELLVGMAASLSSTWKRHALFLETAALLAPEHPNLRFAAFGPEPKRHANAAYNGPWNYYQDLRRQAERLGLGERFVWGGFQRDIPALMDAMDILVHPCDIEPFGRIAIEAMAARRPVVGPDRGGISESVVADRTGLLVPAGDAAAFAAATARLAGDSALRARLGAAGRRHVAEHFSLDHHIDQMVRIFEDAVTTAAVPAIAR